MRKVWIPQSKALFDVRVTDADVSSYVNRSVASFLTSADEKDKEHKYVSCSLLLSCDLPLLHPFFCSRALGHEAVSTCSALLKDCQLLRVFMC